MAAERPLVNKARWKGLILFACGVVPMVATVRAALPLPAGVRGQVAFIAGGFGVVALTGLVQLVAGRPFTELTGEWDAQSRARRLLLGSLIVLGACAIIFSILALYLAW